MSDNCETGFLKPTLLVILGHNCYLLLDLGFPLVINYSCFFFCLYLDPQSVVIIAFSPLCFLVSSVSFDTGIGVLTMASFCVSLFEKIAQLSLQKCLHMLGVLEGKPFWGQYVGEKNVSEETYCGLCPWDCLHLLHLVRRPRSFS